MSRDKDKRKSRRRPLRRSAWVALGPNDLHGCKLFDVSEAGARIEVEDTTPIPDHFMLFLSNNGAARRACQVVWRNSNQLGVKFEKHLTADAAPEPVLATKVNVNPAPSESEPAESA
jgi:hypothetical protein